MFLPKKQALVVQTSEFENMKQALVPVTAQAEKDEKDKPSLIYPEKGCPAPQTVGYKSAVSIEKICAQ